jgi:formylglycine-generating enzyme required for sulfatase activity
MDAALFQPETSMRRALILALGAYGTESLSAGEREPLVRKLLNLYRNDPDAGIHGAAEWTLWQWKQQEKLNELDSELIKVKDWGERRWFVNGRGQTFAVIEGPVEFRMGSPPTEQDSLAMTETLRWVMVSRRFAIADREVTVEQYQHFVNTNPQFRVDPMPLARYSPDGAGPVITVSWFGAAAYCNWLSEKEGLPKDQWCYAPNKGGKYDGDMTIPDDVVKRIGYRLPTEEEWEYACRSGTITSRFYGVSTDLLDRYARYQSNSRDRAWPCGSLQPNDLGLFDMLGNVYEWVQDQSRNRDTLDVEPHIQESVIITKRRIRRGGSYHVQPAEVRSAFRNDDLPSNQNNNLGFRLARTVP